MTQDTLNADPGCYLPSPDLLIIKLLMSDSPQLPPEIIYSYDTHRNIPWNDPEYLPVREYLDPRQIVTERVYQSTPKGGKDRNYVTRRGFYMDYHVKVVKALPSPADHQLGDPWDQSENKKKSAHNKLDLSLSKFTYLDRIAMEEKNRSSPAPGNYNLNKTEEQIKKQLDDLKTKKRYEGDKHFFYHNTEQLSNQVPGMGSYNPHDEIPHLKMNKTTHKLWIEKHKKESDKLSKRHSVEPAPGTHTPIPLGYNTFDRIKSACETSRKRKDKTVFNGFGSDAKFEYTRPSKKKIVEVRPQPTAYNLVLEWKGKGMDLRGNNWIRARSQGRSQSVYH